MLYRIELENDEFEIIITNNDQEAIEEAMNEYDLVLNITKIDEDYNELETIF